MSPKIPFASDQGPYTGIVEIRGDADLARLGAHAKTRRMFEYWTSVRPAGGGLPGRQHLDPAAIPDLLPGIWLLDVQREPLRFRYRLVGTRVVEAIGREVTGLWLDEAHPDVATDPKYLARSRRVLDTGMPSWRRGPPNLWRHEVYGAVENLILPFATDGTSIDMMMTLTVFFGRDGASW